MVKINVHLHIFCIIGMANSAVHFDMETMNYIKQQRNLGREYNSEGMLLMSYCHSFNIKSRHLFLDIILQISALRQELMLVMILITLKTFQMQKVVKKNVRKFLNVNFGPTTQTPGMVKINVFVRQQMLTKL